VAVSSRDLAAGFDFLLEMQESSQFAWLSANLFSKKDNKTPFKPYISVKAGTLNIAVIGLTDKLAPVIAALAKDTEIKSWQETLPELLPKITSDHQFIVLLTSLSEKDCREIASKYPSINLVIQAGNSASNRPPQNLSGTTLLTTTGKQGKYVGILDIVWQPDSTGWETGDDSILAAKTSKRDRLKQLIDRFSNRPELKTRNQALQSNQNPSSYKNRFITIDKSMPDHSTVLEVVNEINKLVNNFNQNNNMADKSGILKRKGFVGWRKCQDCHPAQTGKWRSTRHASAFVTLVEKDQQLNLDCLPCHVTGVSINNPAIALAMPSDLQLVGCEACHGPGLTHINNAKTEKPAPVREETCLGCHTPERDDSFDFINDLQRIKCPDQ
jgi:hypothetical protein